MTTPWMALLIGLWVVVLVLIGLVIGLTRHVRESSRAPADRADPLTRGDRSMWGPRLGSTINLTAASSREDRTYGATGSRDRVVLFLSSSCAPSHLLRDELIAAQEDGFAFIGSDLIVVTDAQGADLFRAMRPHDLVAQSAGEVSRRLGIGATPYGLAVDAAGVVRWSGLVSDFDDILSMVTALAFSAW